MEKYLKLREEVLDNRLKPGSDAIEVEVQESFCSRAAGVTGVIEALERTINAQKLENVYISQTGCAGYCAYEPLITLRRKGREPVTYCRVTPERAEVLISEYALRNRIIEAWTLKGKDVVL